MAVAQQERVDFAKAVDVWKKPGLGTVTEINKQANTACFNEKTGGAFSTHS
jgi:hypothetical protein